MKLLIIIGALVGLQFATANVVKRNCEGCVDEGVTYAINDTWVKSCITYKCVDDGSSEIITKRCAEPGNGAACRDVGATWSSIVPSGDFGYCLDYLCHQSANANVLPYAAGSNLRCNYKGTCMADEAFVDIANCNRLNCNVTGNSVHSYYSDTPDCAGSCTFTAGGATTTHQAGATWLHACTRYTCTGSNSYTSVRECCVVTFNGDTLTFPIGPFNLTGISCSTYNCDAVNGFEASTIGCKSNTGACRPAGDYWMEDCFNYTCVDTGFSGQKSFLNGGCLDNNVCRGIDETWTDVVTSTTAGYEDTGACYEKLCSYENSIFSVTTTDRRCFFGECYDLGTKQDYQPENCRQITCDLNESGGIVTSFPTICKDSNGGCHEFGTNGWPCNNHQCNNGTCNLVDENTILYTCLDV